MWVIPCQITMSKGVILLCAKKRAAMHISVYAYSAFDLSLVLHEGSYALWAEQTQNMGVLM